MHYRAEPPRVRAALVPDAPRCRLAESPLWHDDRWWWVDVTAGRVFCGSPDAAGPGWDVRCILDSRERISAVLAAGPGRVIAVIGRRIDLIDAGRGTSRTVLDVPVENGQLLNDAICDPAGRIWVDVVDPSGASGSGRLLLLDADGSIAAKWTGFGAPNGLAYSPTGDLLHADSADRLVRRLSSAGSGDARRLGGVHLAFGSQDGLPDGLCADDSGGLWVALYGTGEARRYLPTGNFDFVVELPAEQVTSIALGGPDGNDLLVTTAREGYDATRSVAEPAAGRLFMARVPYRAAPVFQFRPSGRT